MDVVIAGCARTAIGTFGGALKDHAACELAGTVVKAALARAGVDPARAQQIVLGNVLHTEPRDMYVSRVAGLTAGMPPSSSALTLNRLCGSGLQAIVTAASALQLGDCDVAVAGGVETMSRAPYLLPSARWGARMGDATLVDMMTGVLTDPFGAGHMGATAENVAKRFAISRDDQDRFALASQQRARAAIEAGHFREQIVPVTIRTRQGERTFDVDEHPKPQTSLESLARLAPAFQKDGGSVTAGNSSGINDAAAACVLMSMDAARRDNVNPLARIVSCAVAGVEPSLMGTGPVPASRLALERAGLRVQDIDVVESNEAFAAQALCVTRQLDLDPARVNPNGGAIALGHPLGASGTILAIKCLHELHRTRGRYGLVTMCIGGGQGIAVVLERP